ncbi:MAG: glycosyltransferase family 2 protein [Thermoleophilaceae bacterium]|nr:glycosyltransferase family 2 protein [Thermoleophilaceae bacterium]
MLPPSPELSVVVPVYGCRDCLGHLHERLTRVLDSLHADHEIVFVDDGTGDGTWDDLQALARRDPAVRAVRLSRNFGQQAAILAGLQHARGRYVAVMDCDLQDPPELLTAMYERAIEGFGVVYGVRTRTGTPRLRRAAALAYSKLMNLTTRANIDPGHGCFSLLSRDVVNAYLRVPDRDRNHMLILYWLGFPHSSVPFDQPDRHSGSSAYTVRSLFRLAGDGVFFQTTVLLRWVIYLGFAVSAAGFGLAAYYLALRLSGSAVEPGFTALAVLILVMSGFVIGSVGVVGLYLGRIFEQVKGRPLYVVAETTDDAGVPEVVSTVEAPALPQR